MIDPSPAPMAAVRCPACRAGYLDRLPPCPRCGHGTLDAITVPARGRVLAATELSLPPPGFRAPHRLVLVEAAEGVRLLARADEHALAVDAEVEIVPSADGVRVRPVPRSPG